MYEKKGEKRNPLTMDLGIKQFGWIATAIAGIYIGMTQILPRIPYVNAYPPRITLSRKVHETFKFPTTIESIVAAETGIKDQEELRYLTNKYTNYLLNVKRVYPRSKGLSPDLAEGGIAYDQEIDFPDLNGNGRIDKGHPSIRTTSSKFPDHPTHQNDIMGQELFDYFTSHYDYPMKLRAWQHVKDMYDYASSQQDKLQTRLKTITQYDELIKKSTQTSYPHDKDLDKYALLAGFAAASYFNSKDPNDFSLGLNEKINQQDMAGRIENFIKNNSWTDENKKLATTLVYLSERAEREGALDAILVVHYGTENIQRVYTDKGLSNGAWVDLFPRRIRSEIENGQMKDGMSPELLIPGTIAFWQHYKEYKDANFGTKSTAEHNRN